jgi:hypothetical protein
MKPGRYLVVNIPRVPHAQIAGIKTAKPTRILNDYTLPPDPGSDSEYYKQNYIVITPMSVDETDEETLGQLKAGSAQLPLWLSVGNWTASARAIPYSLFRLSLSFLARYASKVTQRFGSPLLPTFQGHWDGVQSRTHLPSASSLDSSRSQALFILGSDPYPSLLRLTRHSNRLPPMPKGKIIRSAFLVTYALASFLENTTPLSRKYSASLLHWSLEEYGSPSSANAASALTEPLKQLFIACFFVERRS